MFRAMVVKEVRSLRGIALVSLAAYWLLVTGTVNLVLLPFDFGGRLYGQSNDAVPFLHDDFVGTFVLFCVPLAIALGLWQTISESIHGTYLFLLHRPASRRWLIGTKLCVGMMVYFTCAAIPIFAHGLWAAMPDTHASPFEWSMTVPSWATWFSMSILYFGAFLTGIRPGRWYGTRLLPLAAVIGLAYLPAISWLDAGGLLWPCVIVLVADIWMIATILDVARTRDYT